MWVRVSIFAAAVCVSPGWVLAAGTPQSQASKPVPAMPPTTERSTTAVHLEGCVFPKQALSSPKPVVIPFGTTQDYVLTDTKVIAVASGVDVADGQTFKLDQVPQDRLRGLAGRRVGVTGRTGGSGELPPLEVTSIREITGTCPVVPTHS